MHWVFFGSLSHVFEVMRVAVFNALWRTSRTASPVQFVVVIFFLGHAVEWEPAFKRLPKELLSPARFVIRLIRAVLFTVTNLAEIPFVLTFLGHLTWWLLWGMLTFLPCCLWRSALQIRQCCQGMKMVPPGIGLWRYGLTGLALVALFLHPWTLPLRFCD